MRQHGSARPHNPSGRQPCTAGRASPRWTPPAPCAPCRLVVACAPPHSLQDCQRCVRLVRAAHRQLRHRTGHELLHARQSRAQQARGVGQRVVQRGGGCGRAGSRLRTAERRQRVSSAGATPLGAAGRGASGGMRAGGREAGRRRGGLSRPGHTAHSRASGAAAAAHATTTFCAARAAPDTRT